MKELAIEQIIVDYDIELRYVAYRYVRDWILVDDIMQEVYLKVYLNLGSFEGKANIKSWVYRITVNQCIDYLRKKIVQTTVLMDNPEELLATSRESVEKEMMERLEKEQLHERISSLPKDYQQAISLYYLHDYSYKEISEILSRDLSFVKNKLFRGRRMLKEVYEEKELAVS